MPLYVCPTGDPQIHTCRMPCISLTGLITACGHLGVTGAHPPSPGALYSMPRLLNTPHDPGPVSVRSPHHSLSCRCRQAQRRRVPRARPPCPGACSRASFRSFAQCTNLSNKHGGPHRSSSAGVDKSSVDAWICPEHPHLLQEHSSMPQPERPAGRMFGISMVGLTTACVQAWTSAAWTPGCARSSSAWASPLGPHRTTSTPTAKTGGFRPTTGRPWPGTATPGGRPASRALRSTPWLPRHQCTACCSGAPAP